MANEHPLLGYDRQDDELFEAPLRGANLPPMQTPTATHVPLPPGMAYPPTPAPPPAGNPFGFTPEDTETVTLVLEGVNFKLQVVKAQVDDTAVALFYDSERCDITLQPGQKLTVICRDDKLQVVYAGGKVNFGRFSLLSFIRGATSDTP